MKVTIADFLSRSTPAKTSRDIAPFLPGLFPVTMDQSRGIEDERPSEDERTRLGYSGSVAVGGGSAPPSLSLSSCNIGALCEEKQKKNVTDSGGKRWAVVPFRELEQNPFERVYLQDYRSTDSQGELVEEIRHGVDFKNKKIFASGSRKQIAFLQNLLDEYEQWEDGSIFLGTLTVDWRKVARDYKREDGTPYRLSDWRQLGKGSLGARIIADRWKYFVRRYLNGVATSWARIFEAGEKNGLIHIHVVFSVGENVLSGFDFEKFNQIKAYRKGLAGVAVGDKPGIISKIKDVTHQICEDSPVYAKYLYDWVGACKRFGFGINQLEPIRNKTASAFYLSKYLAKSFKDEGRTIVNSLPKGCNAYAFDRRKQRNFTQKNLCYVQDGGFSETVASFNRLNVGRVPLALRSSVTAAQWFYGDRNNGYKGWAFRFQSVFKTYGPAFLPVKYMWDWIDGASPVDNEGWVRRLRFDWIEFHGRQMLAVHYPSGWFLYRGNVENGHPLACDINPRFPWLAGYVLSVVIFEDGTLCDYEGLLTLDSPHKWRVLESEQFPMVPIVS